VLPRTPPDSLAAIWGLLLREGEGREGRREWSGEEVERKEGMKWKGTGGMGGKEKGKDGRGEERKGRGVETPSHMSGYGAVAGTPRTTRKLRL